MINNVLKEYDDIKEEIKNLGLKQLIEEFKSLFTKQCYRILWSVEKIQKVEVQKLLTQKGEECFCQNNICMIVKKTKFIKDKVASRLLSSLEIKRSISIIPLVDPLLFY